jgi:hypothetical protein
LQRIKYLTYVLPVTLVFLISCGRGTSENKRAFYYWRTNFTLTAYEKQALQNFGIQKLYVRMFDVDWAVEVHDIIPVAEISFTEKPPAQLEVVPTIYITNRAMQNLNPANIETDARKIIMQAESICKKNAITFSEVQFDCDWSESTRDRYFALLNHIKEYLHQQHKQISATIRLHQVKYSRRTGVPPVDRGMLMFYNMGKLESAIRRNSIYNKDDAALYINHLKGYQLPLDVALPVFSLIIQTREQRIVDLINKSYLKEITQDSRFTKLKDDTYSVKSSFFLHGTYFMKDDILHIQQLSGQELREASDDVSEHVDRVTRTITLFDLDSLNLGNFNEKDIQHAFHRFD